jgi:DUF1365 family protein
MVCLELNELPMLVGRRGVIANRRFASRSFLRGDHLYDHSRPLGDEAREIVRRETGRSPEGPIRLLTQLRYFGVYFSPLNLFYIYGERKERLEYIVAEVNNTPWNERHCYVLWDGNRSGDSTEFRFSHPKEFHVSPFMGMDMEYRWRLTEPGARLTVHLTNLQNSQQLFDAAMTLQRRDLTERNLRKMTLRYPLMTTQISMAIYYQAFRLWWKKCPFYTHPRKQRNPKSLAPAPSNALPTTKKSLR